MLNLISLREQIYTYLRDEMLNGGILPDSTLNLNEISQRLGISKTPLRDALIKLEAEGFVTIMPRRGVMVNALTLEDVRDFYCIIGALEGEVINSVFERFNTDHLECLRRLNEAQRTALAEKAYENYYQLNIDFHDVFLDLSANRTLRTMVMPLKQRLYDFQRRPYVTDWELRNCREHDQLIAKIETGDRAGAVEIIRDVHWSFTVQEGYIREFYRNK
ncbi:MAG: GntR family transcriptional regulator [Pseudomonadota bacterium]